MKQSPSYPFRWMVPAALMMLLFSCNKLRDTNQKPELESLQQGLKTSVAVAYCVSVAHSAFQGKPLPENVVFNKNSGLIYINIDENHPLPFNSSTGDIILACLWSGNGGVMSVLFGDVDILEGDIRLYGLYLVPFIEREEGILALYEKQDIILGNGSDTILDLSNITDPVFKTRMDRLDNEKPSEIFAVVKQNVWFINIDRNNTFSNVYDDDLTINGGGQIAEVNKSSGGVIYHAVINTEINYSVCSKNPLSGFALIQNFKAGGEPYIDLGNSLFSFHKNCDGLAHVELSTGKYFSYINKDISLEIQ